MKTLGIISEYNPFHNGHLYHLSKSKELTGSSHTVAIMSGHFLQRGEPALMDKWTRAKIAVENGIDLVIEIPFIYSCQSADIFAYGSINILNQLGVIDNVAFGCENSDLDGLSKIKDIIKNEPDNFQQALKTQLNKGNSYPRARELALKEVLPSLDSYISTPNNILAISYLMWLDSFESDIKPVAIQREKTGYHDLKTIDNFASATYIRKEIIEYNNTDNIKNFVPEKTWYNLINYNNNFNDIEKYFIIINSNLMRQNKEDLLKYFDINEGLENKIIKELGNSRNINELLDRIVSKRYTSTRIKRFFFNNLFRHTKKDVFQVYKNSMFTPYARILAFNKNGQEIIYSIKEKSEIPIISNLGKSYNHLTSLQRYAIDKDVLSTDYYYLPIENSSYHLDYYKKPEIIT